MKIWYYWWYEKKTKTNKQQQQQQQEKFVDFQLNSFKLASKFFVTVCVGGGDWIINIFSSEAKDVDGAAKRR